MVVSRELKDPRVPAITVTQVEVSPDAGQATVFFTMLGVVEEDTPDYKHQMKECLAGLNSAAGFLRRHLAKILTMRSVPVILFKEDKGFSNTLRVNELLKQIAQEKKPEALNEPSAETKDDSKN